MKNFELQIGANRLPRGGYLVVTSVGYIQFGAAPETIKDTMMLPKKVPQIFVLPGELFSVEKGIAVAELEFPIYYNHFLRGGKTVIVCTDEQKQQLKTVLQESVFGPEKIDLSSEFVHGELDPSFPDLRAEMNFFRGKRILKDLVIFKTFKEIDNERKFVFRDVEIVRREGQEFLVRDKGQIVAQIPWTLEFNVIYDVGETPAEPFSAPDFGITCLGPSHGFDPEENTSGFILWISHRGVMIDPPVNSTEWLRKSNVNPKLISHIILTHCHADHDAGTFQKILEENSITIHTTETIMDSFIRKYVALTKIDRDQLYDLFTFNPVMINKPIYIEGGEFRFHYSLHSIPAIGFSVNYLNQSFFYTSDHLNHPETLEKIRQSGCFNEGRYNFLKNFPWHHNIIYHEAGIPPLHTPISYLATLPPEIQKKITVYHIAKKDFIANSLMTLAKFGIENTVYPEIISPKYQSTILILDVMEKIDLFANFPLSKAREFLRIINEQFFHKGQVIIEKNTPGEHFYMIASGNVSVEGFDGDFEKSFGKYEYFGEASLVTGELRSANVIALTDVHLLTIEKNAFFSFIDDTEVEETFKKLAEVRNSKSWQTLSESKIFSSMTSHQKTQLESIMEPKQFQAGTELVRQGSQLELAYIIKSGSCDVTQNGRSLKTISVGDFIGDIFALQKNLPSAYSVTTKEDTALFQIQKSALRLFVQNNPGVYMRLLKNK